MVRGESSRFSAVLLRATLVVCVFGLSVVFAFARIYEAPHSGLTWLRVAISVACIAVVVFAKRGNIAQRVVLAFALETASGVAIFVYVDVPYVTSHGTQIANRIISGYATLTHHSIRSDMRGLTRQH